MGKLRRPESTAPPIHIIDNIWYAEKEQSVYENMEGCALLILTAKKRPKKYRSRNLEQLRKKRNRPLAVQEYTPDIGLSPNLLQSHIPLFFQYSEKGVHICIVTPDFWVALQAICAWLANSDPQYFPSFLEIAQSLLPEIALENLASIFTPGYV